MKSRISAAGLSEVTRQSVFCLQLPVTFCLQKKPNRLEKFLHAEPLSPTNADADALLLVVSKNGATRKLTAEGQRLVSEGSDILKCPLKSQIPILGEGGGGARGNQFPTFDAESRFAKIQNSNVRGEGGGLVETNVQLLMLSSNLLKSKIPMCGGGWGVLWKPISKSQLQIL